MSDAVTRLNAALEGRYAMEQSPSLGGGRLASLTFELYILTAMCLFA